MDSSATDLGVYNANIQYKDRIYNNNTSGPIGDQTKLLNEMQAMNALSSGNYLLQSNGTSADHKIYDDKENYVIKHFDSDDNNSPGYDVITVDPNCFYSSDDEDIVVDIESDQSETNTEHDTESSVDSTGNQYPLMTQSIFLHSVGQSSTVTMMDDISFDIGNVTDLCAVDDHLLNAHDDFLFANGNGDFGQFDLANYVDGGSSSLLLSPPPPPLPVKIARQRIPLKISPAKKALAAFRRNDVHREEDNTVVSHEQQRSKMIENPQPATIATATNGNRRKRRNLTKAFIDTTDDSDSEHDASQSHMKIQQLKKQRHKDDDPVWNPVPNGCPKTSNKAKNDVAATKDSSITIKSVELSKEKRNEKLLKHPSISSSSTTAPSNGLRTMLKKQLLSNRPMKKNPIKVNKVLASPTKSIASDPNIVNVTKKKFGVGRGKDISITAKYFNSSAKSSDTLDRDNTDNDNNNLDFERGSSSSSSGSESDASESSVRSKERIRETEEIGGGSAKTSVEESAGAAKNKFVDKSVAGNPTKSKEVTTSGQAPTKCPVFVDNVDFAKAIFIDAKETVKPKPVKRDDLKKNASEQLMKRPPILFNTANKFKTNCLPIVASSRPFTELAQNGNTKLLKATLLPDLNAKPEIKLPKIPRLRQLKIEPKIEENCTEDVKMEIDVVSVDDSKSDAMATATSKKKLNIQEYLKRKNINPLANEKVKICREEHSYGKPAETATRATADENIHAPNSETSLYEEIISVSMGCGTDISIPEFRVDGADASTALKSTVLLSNIQTTIEKANSAIEQGKISSSSLISSIQEVILKKTTIKKEMDDCVDEKKSTAKKNQEYEHGENKVIMHLRKNRFRPTTITIAMQTDPYFQFPPLERLVPINRKNEGFDRCKSLGRSKLGDTIANDDRSKRDYSLQQDRFANRKYRTRKGQSESSYYSDIEEQQQMSSPQRRSRHSEYLESIAHPSTITNDHSQFRRRHNRSVSYKKNRRYRSSKFERDSNRHRTVSRSLSQSSDTSSSSYTSTSTTASSATVSSASSKSLNSYGDSSTKSYYADDRRRNRSTQNWSRGARNQQLSKHRSDSPEHRRIVYVGRIECETTKDDLRRIFSVYGRVENVTIHYKEMKWKYGFVTFERPADAYKVIDTSSKDPALKDYDISFGGRRTFCREKYLDLDNTEDGYSHTVHPKSKRPRDDSFEALLRKLKEKLQDTKE